MHCYKHPLDSWPGTFNRALKGLLQKPLCQCLLGTAVGCASGCPQRAHKAKLGPPIKTCLGNKQSSWSLQYVNTYSCTISISNKYIYMGLSEHGVPQNLTVNHNIPCLNCYLGIYMYIYKPYSRHIHIPYLFYIHNIYIYT